MPRKFVWYDPKLDTSEFRAALDKTRRLACREGANWDRVQAVMRAIDDYPRLRPATVNISGTGRWGLGDTRDNRPLPKTRLHYPVSACAFELARRVAGYIVTVHAGSAYINALTKLPYIIILVSQGDASTLLIRVLNLLRTRRKADSHCHQNNEASQLHGADSGC